MSDHGVGGSEGGGWPVDADDVGAIVGEDEAVGKRFSGCRVLRRE